MADPATESGATGPRTRLVTARLEALAPPAVDTRGGWLPEALLAYYQRNRMHFAPWDPPRPPDFLSYEGQAERAEQLADAWSAGQGLVWWLRLADQPQAGIVGHMHFSNLVRGPAQSANVGYSLDRDLQGRGLMHEALEAGLAEVFSPRVALHRVQAAVRPENARSLAVLERLGFEREGLAREYLFIDGGWRDHVLAARRSPRPVRPPFA